MFHLWHAWEYTLSETDEKWSYISSRKCIKCGRLEVLDSDGIYKLHSDFRPFDCGDNDDWQH